MTERGQSPPDAGHNMTGEGAGHKVKKGKGKGYARSTHMKGDVGPQSSSQGERGGNPHTGGFKTAETKEHGSAHKLPMEHHVPFRKGIAAGDHFEGEIKEHFPNNKGVAGIHKTAMPHKNSPVESEGPSNEHGKASGKAEHLPGMKSAHMIAAPAQGLLSHGFGHSGDQRKGVFRLSGHPQAHRLGSRSSRSK